MSTFSVTGEVSLDGSKFIHGLNRVESAANRTASNLVRELGGRLAGIFAIGSITAFANSTLEAAGRIQDMAIRTGLGVEELQRMDRTLADNGSSLETLIGFWDKLNRSRNEALSDPKGKQALAFEKLGVSQPDLATKSAQELTKKIAMAVQTSTNVEGLLAPLSEVGPRGVGELVAAFREGLYAMRDDVMVMTADTIDMLDEMGDSWSNFTKNLRADLANSTQPILDGIKMIYKTGKYQMYYLILEIKNMWETLTTWKGLKELGQAAVGGATPGINARESTVMEEAKRYWDQMTAQEKADAEERKKRIEARKAASKLDFKPYDGTKPVPKEKITQLPKGDAMVAVGNFLGQSRTNISRIAESQLMEARLTNVTLRELADSVDDIPGMMDFGVP